MVRPAAPAVNPSQEISAIPWRNSAARRLYICAMDRVTGIQLFIRIVETGSFSKASADLGVTQPTATKQVAALEEHLGPPLLHPSTRGVTATGDGAPYHDQGQPNLRATE